MKRLIEIEDNLARVYLTLGQTSIIDLEDIDLVQEYNWSTGSIGKYFYALRNDKGHRIYLHRFILRAPANTVVDHINGDTLDNRKANIRITDKRGNACNSVSRPNTSSRFKGVSLAKRNNKWEAYICINGKKKNLGVFKNELDAAMAYNKAALENFGEYARLNRTT